MGALVLMVLVRTWIPFGDVFRGGEVYLVANDPYAFRYMVETVLASDLSPFNPLDWRAMPERIRTHDVGFVTALWLVATLLGGSSYATGVVFAVYPVVVAVLGGVMVYLIAVWVTADRRVGVLSVVLLAVTPAHAYRTMLGFGDHDAFGYLATMTVVTALVWLVRADERSRSLRDGPYLLAVFALGAGTVAATLGWRGGPMLFAPLAVFAVLVPILNVKYNRSPLRANRGLLCGLGVGAVGGLVFHVGVGWVQPVRGVAPLLMFLLVVLVVGVAEVVHRAGWPWPVAIGPVPIGGLAVVIGLWRGHPMFADAMAEFRWFLVRPARDIGELVPLVASLEVPLLLFGFLLLVAVPVMLWVVVELTTGYRPNWLLLSVYAWSYLVLAAIAGLRMSGLAAMVVVVFGAIGIVSLAAWMDVARPVDLVDSREGDDRQMALDGVDGSAIARSVGMIALIVLLVMATGLVQLPGTMQLLTHDDTTHETASFIAEYSAERGHEYPENFVLTEWGSNRAYNYHVSGESRSYGFARSHYREFVSSSEPDEWDDTFADRVGFVVLQDTAFVYPTDSMQVRLHERYGSAGDGVDGVGRYRLIYVSEDGSTTVFAYVPGAELVGTGDANVTISVEVDVQVGADSFTYVRRTETDEDGAFSVTVPYPGEYDTSAGSVEVSEEDVKDGRVVEID